MPGSRRSPTLADWAWINCLKNFQRKRSLNPMLTRDSKPMRLRVIQNGVWSYLISWTSTSQSRQERQKGEHFDFPISPNNTRAKNAAADDHCFFGSNDAHWAIHSECGFWSPPSSSAVLSCPQPALPVPPVIFHTVCIRCRCGWPPVANLAVSNNESWVQFGQWV